MILIIFILLSAFAYLGWASSVYRGWQRYISRPLPPAPIEVGISIVIAFRNEVENLPRLLQSIDALHYPAEKVEAVFVNDNSKDGSVGLVKEWLSTKAGSVKVLQSRLPGKKAAQHIGVNNASYGIIACTDADCELPPCWLKRINASFANPRTELAFGAVEIVGREHALQRIEFLALIGSTIAMLQQGWAVMGNAANMAFRKQSYLDVFPSLEKRGSASGDDVFLLHEVAKKQGVIDVLVGNDSVVKTMPQVNFKDLLSQRLRWASKARFYSNKRAIGVGFLVLAINTLLLLHLFAALFNIASVIAFVSVFIVKIAADYFLLRAFATFYGQPIKIGVFLLQEVVNLIYVPAVAVLSQVVQFTWKGRKY